MVSTWLRFCRMKDQSWTADDSCAVVDRPCRKPCWASVRILLDARCLETWLRTMLHYLAGNAGEGDGPVVGWITFVTRLVNLRNESLFPLCWYSAGVITLLKQEGERRKESAGAISQAINLRSLGGTASGPLDLEGLTCCSCFSTPLMSICRCPMDK